jgi:hypothetical protein
MATGGASNGRWNITVIVLHYLSIQLGAIILRDETVPEKKLQIM